MHTGLDDATFLHAYDTHAPAALGLAYRILGDAARAEDAVQEAFVSLWRTRATFDGTRAPLKTLLMTIVHHKSVDEIRRQSGSRAREEKFAREAPVVVEGPQNAVLRAEDALLVREGLAAMPSTHRQVLEQAYFGGLTYREIAEEMGIPLGTVKSRMRSGLEKLAVIVAGLGAEAPAVAPADGGRLSLRTQLSR